MKLARIAVGLAIVLAVGSCGGRPPVFEEGNGQPMERGLTLPEPIPATPVFLAELSKPLTDKQMRQLAGTDGVAVVAPVSIQRMKVEGPKGSARLRVGVIEPLQFRSVAPPATRDAEFVWVALIVGQAVATFDAAQQLGLEGAGEISIAGTPGYQVGAFADNGVPNIADLLVQNGEERTLDVGPPNTFVVGAESGVTIQTLGKQLRRRVPGARFTRLVNANTVPAQVSGGAPAPVGHIEGGVIGAMRFQILEGGFIRPDPSWVAANIVRATVPILGTVTCHRMMIPRLVGALEDVTEAGLAKLIRPGDYGGCYVPRFIDRDPGKPLSNHAFGLAVDINVSTNGLGTRGDMDPRIVEIFKRWGLSWGGYWARPDPMHFELAG